MAGNREGGLKAAETNRAKYGSEFYAEIGKIGGAVGRTGGFYGRPDLASAAGRKGGQKSRFPKGYKRPTEPRFCEVFLCELKHRARGYCQYHYYHFVIKPRRENQHARNDGRIAGQA